MADPGDFLSNFEAEIMEEFLFWNLEAQVTEHWESTRAAHASIAEHIGKKDLEGLMTYDKEDPHGILALAPDALKPCADVIRGFGEAAVACAAEFEDFVKTAQGDLGTFQESCDAATHTELDAEAACLRSACQLQMEMVQSTKSAIEKMDGLSLTGALLLSFDQYRVDQMDDEAKVEQYEKMQKDLHLHHAQQAQTGIQSLLQRSQIPWLHDFVDATQQDQKRLQDRANATAAKLDVADTLCTGLEQQQAELRDKIQKCAQIRRVTIRAEETNRKKLEETEKARQTAWKEYQNACQLKKRGRRLGRSTRMPASETRQQRSWRHGGRNTERQRPRQMQAQTDRQPVSQTLTDARDKQTC